MNILDSISINTIKNRWKIAHRDLTPTLWKNGKAVIHPIVFDVSNVLTSQLDHVPTTYEGVASIQDGTLVVLNKTLAKMVAKIPHIKMIDKKVDYPLED